MTEIKTEAGMRAMINVPDGEGQFPLLIFLHGIAETGTNLANVMKYGPLKQLKDGINIGEPKIIVHPQNQTGQWMVSEIDDILEYCKKTFPVDPNRIYLMGVSLGGLGVWTYAQSPEHVKKLAAIVPICGGGNDPSKAHVLVNEGIPGWAAHAKNDERVAYNVTKRMVDAVNNLAGRVQINFSEYGIYGHSAWVYFLRPEYGVYDWLKFQRLDKRNRFDLAGFKKRVVDFVNAL
jgi:predicted peptidase